MRGSIVIGNGGVYRGEIKNAVMMDGANFPHPGYVGDSLCGYKTHFGNQAGTANLGLFYALGRKTNVTVKLDGNVSLGHKVAVIGGGNTAIDAARVALRLGSSPTIIYRRSKAEMPAFQDEVDGALAEGIDILYSSSPIALEEQKSGLRIKCVKNRMGELDKDGRPVPIPIKGSDFFVDVDTVMSAIGETPDLSFLPPDIAISNRLVRVDELSSTSSPRIFAIGDLIAQPRSVVHAIGSGKMAAIAIDCYIRGHPIENLVNGLGIGENTGASFNLYMDGKEQIETSKIIRFEDLNPNHFQRKERVERPKIPEAEARTSFQEICGNISLEKALSEAQRCFTCGMCTDCGNCYLFCPDASVSKHDDETVYLIDYDYCKGCGICANECPIGFIDMEEE